ncbi:unnamed protein product [Phytophthora fragariaefolia]|uniref:Unnamed protein product n=1 Tax=Phytophthora fragariaefolia TaxID=1490495 RepID=A0A9W6UCI5_9STRA|nr:unnamed protein product [Phytophthora fragariaefolia]
MGFSNLLKIVAVLAVLTLDVNAAHSDQARHLRIESAIEQGESAPTRQLQPGKTLFTKIGKAVAKNVKEAFNYPVVDKAKENYAKIKHATSKK